jgi:hypothetical protein
MKESQGERKNPGEGVEGGKKESGTVTAADIADDLGLNIRTVTDWFGTGRLPGRKIGRNGWTTTRAAYAAFLATHPDTGRYDLTSAQIAAELGISDAHTVRRWFRDEGLPGALVRGIGERGATWRTTRTDFNRWYAAYLERGTTPPASTRTDDHDVVEHLEHQAAGRAIAVEVTDTLATTEGDPA